jgi:hypothetical protein
VFSADDDVCAFAWDVAHVVGAVLEHGEVDGGDAFAQAVEERAHADGAVAVRCGDVALPFVDDAAAGDERTGELGTSVTGGAG